MYSDVNFKTKKALKDAINDGKKIGIYARGLGTPKRDGQECLEGPWYPAPHSWYATVTMKDGYIVGVK